MLGAVRGCARRVLACLLLTCCLSACATTENRGLGRFEKSGFYNRALPYRVTYRDAAGQRILGPQWALANFVAVKKSRSRTALEVGEPREGDHQLVLLEDGDSLTQHRVYRQDLRFGGDDLVEQHASAATPERGFAVRAHGASRAGDRSARLSYGGARGRR